MDSERDKVLCELLVLRCLRGERGAAVELTGMFQRPLLYYLRRMVEDEAAAWDVLQETWMQVFRTMHRIRAWGDGRVFAAYVYRVARNGALARRRKLRREEVVALEACGEVMEIAAPEPGFTAEEAALVHAGLAALPLEWREVLTLQFLEELTLEEIAEVVGVPVGTVKSRLFHARRALRRVLEKEAGHGE